MGVLPHSIFNLFFLYFDSTRVGDAVVKIFALISQSPCIHDDQLLILMDVWSLPQRFCIVYWNKNKSNLKCYYLFIRNVENVVLD